MSPPPLPNCEEKVVLIVCACVTQEKKVMKDYWDYAMEDREERVRQQEGAQQ